MDALLAACGDVPLVEDAAQALGATFGGRPLGTFGLLGAFSFHETKNVGCGEGGALTVRDEVLLDRATCSATRARTAGSSCQGLSDKYTWVDTGSSWVLSDLNAAYLDAQLEALDVIQARRATIHDRYTAELRRLVEGKGGYVIEGHPRNTPNHHIFAIVFREADERPRFIALHAGQRDHDTLPLRPAARVAHGAEPWRGSAFAWSEKLGSCLVRLPLFYNLSDDGSGRVIDRTTEFLHGL